ncbi:hypothetical protein VTH06DRAFT_5466 [Thermothelomyces fergusii]
MQIPGPFGKVTSSFRAIDVVKFPQRDETAVLASNKAADGCAATWRALGMKMHCIHYPAYEVNQISILSSVSETDAGAASALEG